jgi:hypothetical protein
VLEQVLEAEMEEAMGASKGERTTERVGYRADRQGRFCTESLSAISGVRRHWWRPWQRGIDAEGEGSD